MKPQEARDCCPYCGTHFEMDEVYPCAAYYYTVPGIAERGNLVNNIRKELLIAGIISGTLIALLCMIGWNETPLLWRSIGSVLMGVLYGGVSAFCWYMIRSLFLFGKLFFEAGRAMPMMKALSSRKKMTAFMQGNEPQFSYEEFEGKVLSLIRSAAFEDDRESLCLYEGKDDLSSLDKAVDMQYRGALYIRRYDRDGDMLRVSGTAFMTNTYAGRSVSERDEQFQFTVEKKADPDYDPGFTFLKVTCSSCNGSFDAVHQKYCPYCGQEYELKKKDWVLTRLKRK
jgi:hypothetical protein